MAATIHRKEMEDMDASARKRGREDRKASGSPSTHRKSSESRASHKRSRMEDMDASVHKRGREDREASGSPSTHRSSSKSPATHKRSREDVPGGRIAWPPVVVLENTGLGWDESKNQFTGLGNEEVRLFLSSIADLGNLDYRRVIALYDPQGHKGVTFVVFPATDLGYVDAHSLHDYFQRIGHGKEGWIKATQEAKVAPRQSKKNVKRLVAEDGKNILFGYLADPEDMQHLDPQKRVVKRWSVESLEEKVRKPETERNEDRLKTKEQISRLEKDASATKNLLELQKEGWNEVKALLDEKNAEIEAGNKKESEAADRHREEMLLIRMKFDEELKKKKTIYRKREEDIRSTLAENKATMQRELCKLEKQAEELQNGIEQQKERELAAQKRKEALEQMNEDHVLNLRMEDEVSKLENIAHSKLMDLEKKHQEATLRLKEQIAKDREERYRKLNAEKDALNKTVQEAKDETSTLQNEDNQTTQSECIVCFGEFSPTLSRACYADCGHVNVCIKCVNDHLWKNSKKCPTCQKEQAKKPKLFPWKIHF